MVTEIQCHQNPQPSPGSPAGALSLLAPQLAAVATLILRQPWRRNDARLGAASTRRTTTSPPSETPRDLADFQSRHGDAPRFGQATTARRHHQRLLRPRPLASAMPTVRHRSSPRLHVLLLPFLTAHRLVGNAVHGLDLHVVREQAEVLAQRHQRSVLIVHLHAQRAVGLLAHLGDRIERRLVEVLGRHDPHPRHQHRLGLAFFALLELLGDHLIAPGHRLADAGKAELLELANDFLGSHLSPLGPDAHDFRDPSLNHRSAVVWTLGHQEYRMPTHSYAATREAAM